MAAEDPQQHPPVSDEVVREVVEATRPEHDSRPQPGEKLQAIRTLIIGMVVMWVVLVAAWAGNKAFTRYTATQYEQEVTAARLRLASVSELSAVFNEVNTAVEPAVVKIDVLRPANRPTPFGMNVPEANTGSGVIVEVTQEQRREVGYVVTNHHVVAGANQIVVTLATGLQVEASPLGTDPQSDLAVLRIVADGLIAAEWGDSNTLRKGDWVLAFGSPFGFVGSMTSGIVSALNRTQTDGIIGPMRNEAYQNFIQVDAAINPGNSGGPLVNVQGQIVGINSAIFTRTGDFSGIGFAIPSNQAKRVYDDIRERGRVVRGWLGVRFIAADVQPELAMRLGFDPSERNGVVVTQVFRNTPAAEAGLLRGDIITQINDTPITNANSVRNLIAFTRPGERLELSVFRNGGDVELPLVIGEQPDGLLSLNLQPQGVGLELADPPTQSRSSGSPESIGSAVVVDVEPGSLAEAAGIREGDRILAIDGQPVVNAESAHLLLAQGSPEIGIELRLVSRGRVYTVILREE